VPRETNKTQAIVEFCKQNPTAKPKDIAEALEKQGIKVKPQYISSIRTKFGLTKRARRKGRAAAAAGAQEAKTAKATPRKAAVAYESLVEASKFVKSVGDVETARQALDAFAKLQ
jgi:arginine repressor